MNSGVGRSTKKVRTRSDLPPESEDPTVDRNGQKIQGFDLPKNPRGPIQLMDSENDFFLVRFHEEEDYNKVLVGGLWVIFGNYLSIRPWSSDFSTTQNEITFQVMWIRLPGLLERFYSSCLLKEIGQTVGSVVKLDIHTDYACRGCFARLAVCVDLRKSLVSEVRINGQLQRVEYESLPDVCFKCECYGHGANLGTGTKVQSSDEDSVMAKSIQEKFGIQRQVKEEPFGAARNDGVDGGYGGSQFAALGRDEDEIHGVIDGKDDVRAFGGNEGVIFGEGNGRKNVEQFGEMKNQEKAIRMVENFGFKKSNGFSKNLKLG
ncbi:hypothetical protein Gogos_000903 [Gossypium gossypioides]|uniref:DUF4283 domain-containing protein n=1 Tax=Gossypium gossypioides TaxID=34282 RepID=A0A7J9CUA2_GOSGO|nr:hypothetical protein [Gossypium gossypioides]